MIILIGGFPGCGKTFFAKRLASRMHAHLLSSDKVRKVLNAAGKYKIDDKLHIYRELSSLAEERITKSKDIVIVDATFSHQRMRNIFISLAKRLSVPLLFIWIYASEELIKKRLDQPREDSEADYSVFEKIRKQFEPITMAFLSLESTDDNIEQMLAKAGRYHADERALT